MNREPTHSFLFGPEVNPPRGWRSYATSFIVHVLVILVLLLIPVAVTRQVEPRSSITTLIAPPLKPYQPKIKPPRIQAPKLVAKNEITPVPPKPEIKPPIAPPVVRQVEKRVETPLPKPVEHQIAAEAPKPVPHLDTPEPAPAPRVRPSVHTGVFAAEDAAKKAAAAKQLAIGGFGDPNGAHANPNAKSPTLLAKVGGFENPEGAGQSGGAGGRGRAVVRQGAFGAADGAGSGPGGNGRGIGHGTVQTSGFGSPEGGNGNGTGGNGRGGSVKTGGFGANVAAAPQTQRALPAAPSTTPVEILSKPRPVYTQEARDMHLEGEVSLEVVFSASGSVQVLRVIQGLGHGLDQAAERAATQIRFKPGMRGGSPVDTRATIHITFELT
jgi:TonB family protein